MADIDSACTGADLVITTILIFEVRLKIQSNISITTFTQQYEFSLRRTIEAMFGISSPEGWRLTLEDLAWEVADKKIDWTSADYLSAGAVLSGAALFVGASVAGASFTMLGRIALAVDFAAGVVELGQAIVGNEEDEDYELLNRVAVVDEWMQIVPGKDLQSVFVAIATLGLTLLPVLRTALREAFQKLGVVLQGGSFSDALIAIG